MFIFWLLTRLQSCVETEFMLKATSMLMLSQQRAVVCTKMFGATTVMLLVGWGNWGAYMLPTIYQLSTLLIFVHHYLLTYVYKSYYLTLFFIAKQYTVMLCEYIFIYLYVWMIFCQFAVSCCFVGWVEFRLLEYLLLLRFQLFEGQTFTSLAAAFVLCCLKRKYSFIYIYTYVHTYVLLWISYLRILILIL